MGWAASCWGLRLSHHGRRPAHYLTYMHTRVDPHRHSVRSLQVTRLATAAGVHDRDAVAAMVRQAFLKLHTTGLLAAAAAAAEAAALHTRASDAKAKVRRAAHEPSRTAAALAQSAGRLIGLLKSARTAAAAASGSGDSTPGHSGLPSGTAMLATQRESPGRGRVGASDPSDYHEPRAVDLEAAGKVAKPAPDMRAMRAKMASKPASEHERATSPELTFTPIVPFGDHQ